MSALTSWTEANKDEAGGVLVKYAQALDSRIEQRIGNWELYAAVYSEQLEASLRPSRARNLAQPNASRNANLTFNVARSLVETEHATVTESNPRPTIITEEGSRKQQDNARELQRATDGILSDQRGYDIVAQCELDKCVLGTGVTKIHRLGDRPMIERVLISEILVDEDMIGSGQDPRQLIHRTELSRQAVLTWFDGAGSNVKQAIMNAPSTVSSGLQSQRADLITVYDAYTLPLDSDHPGKHAIAIEGYEKMAFEEPWLAPRLPFVFQRWQRPTNSFYGVGIVEQVLGIQVEINRFFRTVSRALKMWGVPTALIPTLSKINTQTWHNSQEGKFIPFEPGGGQPVMWSPQILTPEVMQWLKFNIDIAYQVTGIPQNTAFAQREAGIPSAKGQREVSQKAASRLAPQSKQYERAFVDACWLLDDIIRDIKKDGRSIEISSATNGALHKVDIDAAISLEPGTYRFDIFAGNLLSRHPASKKEEIQELAQAGVLTPEEVKQLIFRPDLEGTINKDVDVSGIYKRQIALAVDKGIYTEPESLWPQLELGAKLYTDALFENQSEGVPDDRLSILRDWLTKARDIMIAAQPPPQEQPQQEGQQ